MILPRVGAILDTFSKYLTKAIYDTDNDGIVDHAETVVFTCRNSSGTTIPKGSAVGALVAVPLLPGLALLAPGKGAGGAAPWKNVHSLCVYAACIPGMFAAVLTAYALFFQNADLLQVVKVILGDMLGATYVVDPAVQGEVTMQTSRPLSRTDLVPTLELLLRMNDAAIVMDGAVYRIVPLVKAATGVSAGRSSGARIFRCLAAPGCASCRCST